MTRCEATNAAGARCLYSPHDDSYHLFADDLGRSSFDLGKLQTAVRLYLDGHVDRDSLAVTLAETEAER